MMNLKIKNKLITHPKSKDIGQVKGFISIVKKWSNILKDILPSFNIDISDNLFKIIKEKYLNLLNSNGLTFTINYFKTTRLAVFQYVASNPCETLPQLSLTKDGIPA